MYEYFAAIANWGPSKAINEYPIATLTKAPNPGGAKAFVEYVLSDQGKAVLIAAGFSAP